MQVRMVGGPRDGEWAEIERPALGAEVEGEYRVRALSESQGQFYLAHRDLRGPFASLWHVLQTWEARR